MRVNFAKNSGIFSKKREFFLQKKIYTCFISGVKNANSPLLTFENREMSVQNINLYAQRKSTLQKAVEFTIFMKRRLNFVNFKKMTKSKI